MPYDQNTSLTGPGISREDINFLAPNNFKIVIDNNAFHNLELYIQKVNIPDITLPKANLPGPMRNIGGHGDNIDYSPLECTFLIDEDLNNYKEVHDWILGQLVNQDGQNGSKTRDITLIINTSHNNATKQISFIDAYPTSLSSVPFESDISDVEYMVANVTFEYSYYKFI